MKEAFVTIKIKLSVALKFRKYARELSKSQSETLRAMLRFFEIHWFTPYQSLGPNMESLENKIMKRFNSLIAIIRDIEKNHDKPNTAMLELLFQGLEPEEPAIDLEALYNDFDTQSKTKGLEVSKGVQLEQEMVLKILEVLDAIEPVKNAFGKPYLKLTYSLQEIKKIRRALRT